MFLKLQLVLQLAFDKILAKQTKVMLYPWLCINYLLIIKLDRIDSNNTPRSYFINVKM